MQQTLQQQIKGIQSTIENTVVIKTFLGAIKALKDDVNKRDCIRELIKKANIEN
jgi:hypothetical protein